MKSIALVTGRPDGSDGLDQGTLEVSADGKTFIELVRYVDGVPCEEPQGRTIQAIRIKPAADLGHPLVIRELTIASDPPVAIFAYPVEFVVDVSDGARDESLGRESGAGVRAQLSDDQRGAEERWVQAATPRQADTQERLQGRGGGVRRPHHGLGEVSSRPIPTTSGR